MPFSTRTMTPADWAECTHFDATEFRHPGKLGFEFVRWLEEVRARAGVPMHPSSDYRDPGHNARAGGATKSAHMDVPCDACDFAGAVPGKPMPGAHRLAIVRAAIELGCSRVGVYENGSVHLDRTEDRRPSSLWVKV